MATAAAQSPNRSAPRGRSGLRIIVVLLIVVLVVGAAIVWLNVAAQAGVNASGTLTVYQPSVSTSHNATDFAAATTGTLLQAGDSVRTDTRGRASITMPDGTLTRLAGDTTVKLDSAHFTKNGGIHDVSLTQQIGRTLTNVQHLVSGSTFDVHGRTATASVRGTKFEVYTLADGTMTVKLFDGTLIVTAGGQQVTLQAGQQVTVAPDGTIGPVGPIVPDPNDPFGPSLNASNAVAAGTTPGTEQDFIGGPIHNGERQQYTYSYAGGNLVKASLGYPGSAMKLTVKAPDGQQYVGTGKLPLVTVNNAPSGVYTIFVDGVSGLGPDGEEPFVAVASVESCTSADIAQGGAVHRGYTAQDLITAVRQSGGIPGMSNLNLRLGPDSISGAIVSGSGTYNGVGWGGTVVMVAHKGALDIMPISATIFGMSVPAPQVVQQIASMTGQDPSNVNPGFTVDRLFTCNAVLMVDGRTA